MTCNKMMYVIKTQKLAAYLMEKGFKLEKTDLDKNNPRFNIFLFEKTEQLIKTIENYKKEFYNK